MITQFTIFKVKDHNGDEKKPTHSLSAKVGEEFIYIGKCWTKENANGKFLSCSLDKPYMDKKGYKVVEEKNNASAEPEDVASDSSPF
jgi:uncharacterized protein (DUF736 family)